MSNADAQTKLSKSYRTSNMTMKEIRRPSIFIPHSKQTLSMRISALHLAMFDDGALDFNPVLWIKQNFLLVTN
jgi:hypothetical protein